MITDYGNTNSAEDFAESVRYALDTTAKKEHKRFKKENPQRYQAIVDMTDKYGTIQYPNDIGPIYSFATTIAEKAKTIGKSFSGMMASCVGSIRPTLNIDAAQRETTFTERFEEQKDIRSPGRVLNR